MIRCWLGLHAWTRTVRSYGQGGAGRIPVLVCTRCRAARLPRT